MVRFGIKSILKMENYQSKGFEVSGNQVKFEGRKEIKVVGIQAIREGNVIFVFLKDCCMQFGKYIEEEKVQFLKSYQVGYWFRLEMMVFRSRMRQKCIDLGNIQEV